MAEGPVYVPPPMTCLTDVVCKFDDIFNDIQRQLTEQYEQAKKLRLPDEMYGGIYDQLAIVENESVTLDNSQLFCPFEVIAERQSRTQRKRSKRSCIGGSATGGLEKVIQGRKCETCGPAGKIKYDEVHGDVVCMTCGTVLLDHVVRTNEYTCHFKSLGSKGKRKGGGDGDGDGCDIDADLVGAGDDQDAGVVASAGIVSDAVDLDEPVVEDHSGTKRKRKPACDSPSASVAGSYSDLSSTYYKRINHLKEVILQVQGKENVTIPEEVILLLIENLHKERIYDFSRVTVKKVFEILKKNRATKFYSHVQKIHIELTGQPGPHIECEHVKMLEDLFNRIQEPFERFKGKRKSMIYYHYVCYKIFEMLQLYQYLPLFRFMKGDPKIKQADEIWEKVCDVTPGMVFIPTPCFGA